MSVIKGLLMTKGEYEEFLTVQKLYFKLERNVTAWVEPIIDKIIFLLNEELIDTRHVRWLSLDNKIEFHQDCVLFPTAGTNDDEQESISVSKLFSKEFHEDLEAQICDIVKNKEAKAKEIKEQKIREEKNLYLKLKDKYGDS